MPRPIMSIKNLPQSLVGLNWAFGLHSLAGLATVRLAEDGTYGIATLGTRKDRLPHKNRHGHYGVPDIDAPDKSQIYMVCVSSSQSSAF